MKIRHCPFGLTPKMHYLCAAFDKQCAYIMEKTNFKQSDRKSSQGSNILLNNAGSTLLASWPALLVAALAGITIGRFDAFMLQSWTGIIATSIVMLLLLMMFHLRVVRVLRVRHGLTLTFSALRNSRLYGQLFLCTMLFLLLTVAGLLPLWLHSHISVEADAAAAMGDPTDLPSYFTALGMMFGAVFSAFTLCSSLVLWLPLSNRKG